MSCFNINISFDFGAEEKGCQWLHSHPITWTYWKMFFFILLQLPHMKRRITVTPNPSQVRGVLLPGGCVATSLDACASPWEHTRHSCPWKHFPKLGSKALLYHTECEQLQEITQRPGCPQHYHPFSLSLPLEKQSSCKYFILDTFILDTILLEYPDCYV